MNIRELLTHAKSIVNMLHKLVLTAIRIIRAFIIMTGKKSFDASVLRLIGVAG